MLALPVHAVPGLVVQPAELLALPLLAYAASRVVRDGRLVTWTSVDVGVLSWLAGVVIAAVVFFARGGVPDGDVLHDVGATAYLAVLYFGIRVVADDAIVGAAIEAFISGATVAAILGVIGFALSELGVHTPLAFAADSVYPYLGNAARARALTATPNMLASILMLAMLLLASGVASRWSALMRGVAFGLLSLGFALAFSKTVVALVAGLVILWALRTARGSRRAALGIAIWLVASAAFSVFSHLAVVCDTATRPRLEEAMFISGEPLFTLDFAGRRCALHPTNYFFNKRASLIAIERSWPWGIGPGRHPAFAGQLRREGLYPVTQWLGAPHSSYSGSAAELGLAGVLGLAAFLGGLSLGIRDALRRETTRPLAVAAAAAFAALLIEAIATDVMHFRHYTWLAALVGAAAARVRE